MLNVTRINDRTSPIGRHITGSPDTFANNIKVTRLYDRDVSVCGSGYNITSSPDVFVNNIPVHRLYDRIIFCLCSGKSVQGSPDFLVD